jgi:diguanylate cyclase (GGDEF)-like protein
LYARSRAWIAACAIFAAALGLWGGANALLHFSALPEVISPAVPLIGAAWIFWNKGEFRESPVDRLLALSLIAWALLQLSLPLDLHLGLGYENAIQSVAFAPISLTAILLIIASDEDESPHTERNMLALSNLNLATSGFVGGEIQRMLSQALDRVLGVVRLPAGALFLHHGDPQGPTSVVAVGLSDEFCRTAQDEGLDDYLVSLVARLGGLLGFRDLRDDSFMALEKEKSIRRFRELALAQGLRSVVAISLQAKEQAFGVLLLGTPDSRRFTSAELRLLLALGHQIGMAVENSYLIQQTSRRTEELHVLNEIGRALSSTLNKEDLTRKVWEELRRLFDVENFYIAERDPLREEIQFDLEIVDGARLPKRARPAGNHITEYIIRTRQPVLIRENYLAEMKKLGVEPLRTKGCFCGVPLVAYDHAIGAMAVYSDHERVFDEGHLELLSVLASEASIAIENARLFSEERTKSQHLSLLNAVSRSAIATLNPDEMLAKITEQLEAGLTYDHIGIGVLDYATREVVIQAEAGKRRGTLGQRLSLGAGLIGHVARNGHMAAYSAASPADSALKPQLPDSVAAIALPVFYAEQLHGILYIESSVPVDFPEEKVLLLRTLADLIAGTLHNALSFQKAQEQATTDGLTGAKTHRFFMEALSAKCRKWRTNHAGFAMVMCDLDRFKAVNDAFGHLEGDAVLTQVANVLYYNAPRGSTVARLGGDEFAVLLDYEDMSSVLDFAELIRAELVKDDLLSKRGITASIGVATPPKDGADPKQLAAAADEAMYKSKHSGGNRVSVAGGNPSASRAAQA